MPDTEINITERLQKIGKTAEEYKDAVVGYFKDMDMVEKLGMSEERYSIPIFSFLSLLFYL